MFTTVTSAHELNEYLTNRADQEFELVKVNELNDHEINDRELLCLKYI